MKSIDIPAASRLKLTKATPRKETHGKELVQAISLRLEWWPTDNAAVNLLHPNLQDLLFYVPEEAAAQDILDGVPAVKKHRRVPTLRMPLKVDASFSGYTIAVDHGIDDSTALELYGCALDKFEVEAKEGGSACIRFSLASNKCVTPQLVGALCGLEGSEIVATLTPPSTDGTEATGAEIDGTTEAFERDHPDAGDLFAAQHGGQGPDDDEGDQTDGEGSDFDAAAEQPADPERGENWPYPRDGAKSDADLEAERDAELDAQAANEPAPARGRGRRKAA